MLKKLNVLKQENFVSLFLLSIQILILKIILMNKFGIIGAAAGSLFVFKGVYRAVLINYPNRIEKDGIICDNLVTSEKYL